MRGFSKTELLLTLAIKLFKKQKMNTSLVVTVIHIATTSPFLLPVST
jgi:hypothetical protein